MHAHTSTPAAAASPSVDGRRARPAESKSSPSCGGLGRDRRSARLLARHGGLLLAVGGVVLLPTASRAQLLIEASYGVDRNISSTAPEAEVDGVMNVTVQWISSSGLGLGIGVEFHFEDVAPSRHQLEGGAVYVSPSYERRLGAVAPFVRGGIGLGRAPCQGDTCTDGVDVRGSAGLRVRVVDKLGVLGEIGVSRVSWPFATVGVSLRL